MNPNAKKFVETKDIALMGASATKNKFGNTILAELSKRGFNIYPVHLTAEKIDGHRAFRQIDELPEKVKSLCVCMKPDFVRPIIDDLVNSQFENIWFQQGADYAEFADRLRQAGKNVVTRKCILMYAGDVGGIHAVHKFFSKLFGKY